MEFDASSNLFSLSFDHENNRLGTYSKASNVVTTYRELEKFLNSKKRLFPFLHYPTTRWAIVFLIMASAATNLYANIFPDALTSLFSNMSTILGILSGILSLHLLATMRYGYNIISLKSKKDAKGFFVWFKDSYLPYLAFFATLVGIFLAAYNIFIRR